MLYVACFLAGVSISFIALCRYSDARQDLTYRMQQKRGDYWFTRYLQACEMLQRHNEYLPNEDPKDYYKC
jgi:hypothetical protein